MFSRLDLYTMLWNPPAGVETTGTSSGRTRYAPTPSGFLHAGNIASFRLTHQLARESGRHILLRIDDLDRERVRSAYVDDIFKTLRRERLDWDLGPRDPDEFEAVYSQIHRLPLYEAALEWFRIKGLLFACVCSRSMTGTTRCSGVCRDRDYALDRSDVSWRLKTEPQPENLPQWPEGQALLPWPESISEPILRRKDGLPAYHLSTVVDDLYFDIDLIVRGMDLLESSIIHRRLARMLDEPRFERIRFVHHDLVLDARGHKLSKSGAPLE